MKKMISLLLAVMMLATSLTAFAEEAQSPTDIIDFLPDEKPAPEDNLFANICWDAINEAEIPTGQSLWRFQIDVMEEIKADLSALIDDIVANAGTYEAGTSEQKIADLYLCYIDEEGRNATGLTPLRPYLDAIENAANVQEYVEALTDIRIELGQGSVIGFSLSTDDLDSTKYSVYMSSMSLGSLGQSYLDDDTMTEYWDIYKEHVANLFKLYGVEETEAVAKAEAIFAMEKDLSAKTMSYVDYTPENTYNPKTLDELKALLSNIDIEPVLAKYGFTAENGVNEYIVSDLEQAAAVNELLTEENLPLLKDFSVLSMLESMAYYLTMDFRAEDERYDGAMSGVSEHEDLATVSKTDVQNTLSWNFGQIYVERYFPEEYKADIEEMVDEIIATYRTRIDKLDWMSDETKAGANRKLDTLDVRIGYPDDGDWPTYLMDVEYKSPADGGTLIENILNLNRARAAYSLSHLGQPVDKSQWGMTPQTVNAYYDPSANVICFPAGIIRGVYYDPNRSRATNLGAIGTVIGHEISHAFDNYGALYDEKGNLNTWWTDEDFAYFKELQEEVSAYYTAFEVWPGYHVDGDLTLGENIADLGSVSCICDIIGDDPEALREMFESYAYMWACKMTRGELESRTRTDSHSTGIARVNAVCSSIDAFYEAFDVKEGDGMYVAPEDRVGIW